MQILFENNEIESNRVPTNSIFKNSKFEIRIFGVWFRMVQNDSRNNLIQLWAKTTQKKKTREKRKYYFKFKNMAYVGFVVDKTICAIKQVPVWQSPKPDVEAVVYCLESVRCVCFAFQ